MKVKLGDVCDKASSNIRQKDIIDGSGNYPIYGAAGKLGLVDFYQQDNAYIGVVKDGAGIGRTVLLPPKSSVIGTMQYLIPKENVLPEYLYYVVKHMHLEKFQTGATIPHIYFKDYKNVTFDLVPIEKQKQIVEQFSKIERILQVREQQLSNLDTLVKARFVEMFGDVSKYELKSLAEVTEVIAGGDKPKDISEKLTEEYRYPVYANGVANEGLQCYSKEYRVEKEAVTISARGTIGATFIRQPFFTPIVRLIAVVPNREVNVTYLKYAIDALGTSSTGSSQQQLTIPNVKKEMIAVPPLEKQKEFEQFVRQSDKSKVAIQKSLDETQLLFDSLMQEYFS